MRSTMLKLSVGLLLWFSISSFAAAPHVAFYYGANPPWDVLQAYDIVVVEAAHGIEPRRLALPRTQLFAYVSVGEVEYHRPYAKDIPQGAVGGANEPWRSHVVDQTHSEWPTFFVERVVAPLWAAGYRGFFLDTLDSFHLIASSDEERARQIQGLAGAIRALRARFPEAKLIFNRGFEILPELHQEAYAVAAESLFHSWNQKSRSYAEVSAVDHAWLLQQLERVRTQYNLPVIAIEYAPPAQRDLARATARRVEALGFIPWVTNSDLDQLGVGTIEVMPRKVLIIHDGADRDARLYAHRIQVQAKTPLTDLGYSVEYADISQPLPSYPLVGRYAGIISWFANDQAVHKPGVREWLARQREHGMRMGVLGSFPFPLTDALALAFGLSAGPPRSPRTVSVDLVDPLVARAATPVPDPRFFTPLRANQPSVMLLRLRSDGGDIMDAAALMPWGGYVLTPYESVPSSGVGGDRWLIDAGEFMRRALALQPISANGRTGSESPTGATHYGAKRCELEQNASERSSINCA